MGREIRRVPPNWEHPQKQRYDFFRQKSVEEYQPLYDKSADQAWREWRDEFRTWLGGEHERVRAEYKDLDYPLDEPYQSFCNWHGAPPDPEYYRPQWKEGEATWYQVYETVSEGTPVTPPFETEDELIDYLVKNGDFWDQERRERGVTDMDCEPWSRECAEKFVRGPGWAPSFVNDSKGFRSGVKALCDEDD